MADRAPRDGDLVTCRLAENTLGPTQLVPLDGDVTLDDEARVGNVESRSELRPGFLVFTTPVRPVVDTGVTEVRGDSNAPCHGPLREALARVVGNHLEDGADVVGAESEIAKR